MKYGTVQVLVLSVLCRDEPDNNLAGYPASLSESRIPDIRCRSETGYPVGFLTKLSNVKYPYNMKKN
jgi:hypothetical protein